ncbi:sugar transferase [Candidatus Saccharibacteria bacterium]|nr:sugar transferase [Candidatus Saccharibacteria bacterium]
MQRTIYLFFKRAFDIVIGLIGLLILIPAIIIIKIAYMCTGDFHRVIYGQTRVGKGGKEFKIYKFRSMVYDADKQLKDLLEKKKYRAQWEKYQKLEDDPRITKVGKVIRRGSIDEIPQFLNILLGQMSLIGPRPLVPGELKQHKGNPEIYNSVKPGMTGYWATRGRSDIDYEDRLKMEYYYIENQSFLLDTKIFFRTIRAVFRKEGTK